MVNPQDSKISNKKIHKVVVDRKLCISAGTCIVVSPNGFEFDEENIAVVKPGAHLLSDDELLMAAQSCPTQAILLFDENGNQIFPKI
jgi:ferredoxin